MVTKEIFGVIKSSVFTSYIFGDKRVPNNKSVFTNFTYLLGFLLTSIHQDPIDTYLGNGLVITIYITGSNC